jgi:ribonuclease VapC
MTQAARTRRDRAGMIIIDSSAVVTILFGEPSSAALAERLAADPDRVISAAAYLEVGTLLAGRRRSGRLTAIDDLDTFLNEAGIVLAPVDAAQARLALRARIVHGRGMGHGGMLNFGDAFAYAWPSRSTRRCSSSATTSPRPMLHQRSAVIGRKRLLQRVRTRPNRARVNARCGAPSRVSP